MLECGSRGSAQGERGLAKNIMDERDVRKFLAEVRSGKLTLEAAVERLRGMPYEDLGFAKIDHHRALRQGYPEVIYARGKTPRQVSEIVRGMLRAEASYNILITRADAHVFRALKQLLRRSPRKGKSRGAAMAFLDAEFNE